MDDTGAYWLRSNGMTVRVMTSTGNLLAASSA